MQITEANLRYIYLTKDEYNLIKNLDIKINSIIDLTSNIKEERINVIDTLMHLEKYLKSSYLNSDIDKIQNLYNSLNKLNCLYVAWCSIYLSESISNKIIDYQESEYYYIVLNFSNDLYLQYSINGYSFGDLITAIRFSSSENAIKELNLLLKTHNSINKENLSIIKIKTKQEKEKICIF